MSAVILPFPGRSTTAATSPFSVAWWSSYSPLIDAALDIVATDDREFDRRFRLISDEEGRTLVGDLACRLERLGAHVADVGDACSLAAARISDALGRSG